MVRREPEEIGVVTFSSLGVWALLRHPDDFANAWSMVNIFRLPSADSYTLLRTVDFRRVACRRVSVVPPDLEWEFLFVQAKLGWARSAVEDLIWDDSKLAFKIMASLCDSKLCSVSK